MTVRQTKVMPYQASILVPVSIVGSIGGTVVPAFFHKFLTQVAAVAGGYSMTNVNGGYWSKDYNTLIVEPMIEVTVHYNDNYVDRTGAQVVELFLNLADTLLGLGEEAVAIKEDGVMYFYQNVEEVTLH